MRNLPEFYAEFIKILCEIYQNLMIDLPKFYLKFIKILYEIFQILMQNLF